MKPSAICPASFELQRGRFDFHRYARGGGRSGERDIITGNVEGLTPIAVKIVRVAMKLCSFFNSSASYRVRIALALRD